MGEQERGTLPKEGALKRGIVFSVMTTPTKSNSPVTTAQLAETHDPLDPLATIRARTSARIFVGRSGPAYRTRTQLALRLDHAAARDAVYSEINLERNFESDFLAKWRIFEVASLAKSKTEYLMRPDLGRLLSAKAKASVGEQCPASVDFQVVIGDGLSAAAVVKQVPRLLPLLAQGAQQRGWRFGLPFFIRYCRVGVLNDLGELLDPLVVVLLIGERPGLATADSLSAYMAYRPRCSHTDAERNLISNIHAPGQAPEAAAKRILRLAEQLRRAELSGVAVKEELDALPRNFPQTLTDDHEKA